MLFEILSASSRDKNCVCLVPEGPLREILQAQLEDLQELQNSLVSRQYQQSRELAAQRNSLLGRLSHLGIGTADKSIERRTFCPKTKDLKEVRSSLEDQYQKLPKTVLETPGFREVKNYHKLSNGGKNVPKISMKRIPNTSSWSIRSLSVAQVDEDTSDQNFLKRHDKLEKRERKRQRLEAQRERDDQRRKRTETGMKSRKEGKKTRERKLEWIQDPSVATHLLVKE